MLRTRARASAFAIGASVMLACAATPASAHHAFAAEYDENRHVTISGTVTKFKWTNPHAWLYVDRRDEGGKVTRWSFEMGSPAGLSTAPLILDCSTTEYLDLIVQALGLIILYPPHLGDFRTGTR